MRQQSAFEIWMRTGWELEPELDPREAKFNPWHDPDDGRFTFAGQGRYFGRGGATDTRLPPTARSTGRLPPSAAGPSRQATRAQLKRIAREEREREAFRKAMVDKEGDENVVYRDTRGFKTVGIGHKVTDADALEVGDRITAAQKEAFFRADADVALRATRSQMREAGITEPSFLVPLASVNYQLGGGWYREHKNTWALIRARRYAAAAREVQNSDWYRQTQNRAEAFRNALLRLERAEQARRVRVGGQRVSR